jgi:PAS domain-containing protein
MRNKFRREITSSGGLMGNPAGTSEDQLRTIIDAIPVLAWSLIPDGSAEFFNRRLLDYAGHSIGRRTSKSYTQSTNELSA